MTKTLIFNMSDKMIGPSRRHSIGVVPRLVAPLAWVQIPVTAFCPPWGYINFLTHITWNKKTIIIYSVQTGTIRFTTKTYFNFIVRYGVVGNISACHADARGSIPRDGV